MSGKTSYVDLSREAIDTFDAAFNTSEQQENAGSSSDTDTETGLDGYTRQPPHADGTPFYGHNQTEKPRR